jgi:hypothetical protein
MTNNCIPPGSAADPGILLRPASPSTPFEFPFDLPTQMYGDFNVTDGMPLPLLRYSISKVVGLPRVCGLARDNDIVVKVLWTAANYNDIDIHSLIDGGANICIPGLLDLLVEVVFIPLLPISVATMTGGISVDDCCTKKGLLPLTMDNGSFYYQPCYYCKNAGKTIISPQAILAASDVLVQWTQTGHKDSSPGTIQFDSNSGLLSMTMMPEKRDGLYYCPTDVFTINHDPVRCNVPSIHQTFVDTPPIRRRNKEYSPVAYNCLTESELWMLCLGSPGEDQLDLMPGNVTDIPPSFQYHPFRFLDWKEEA